MHVPHRIAGLEIERSQVHGVVGLVVAPMESDPYETLLEDVPAANIQLNRPLCEFAASNLRNSVPLTL